MEEYNAIYGQQQIENINFTINLINISNNKKIKHKDSESEKEFEIEDDLLEKTSKNEITKNENNNLEIIKKNNIQKCVQWCIKNNLPHVNINNTN